METRYKVQHRLQSDSWTDINHAFFARRDAFDYASMCSCYPIIYGMTRVVDTLDDSVLATFSAGEGLTEPLHKPGMPPYHLHLRYTVTAAGETWGWLSKGFDSVAKALAFAHHELFPRKICDAVRVWKDGKQLVEWHNRDGDPTDSLQRHLDHASRVVADMPPWKRNILRNSGKPNVSEARKPVRNGAAQCDMEDRIPERLTRPQSRAELREHYEDGLRSLRAAFDKASNIPSITVFHTTKQMCDRSMRELFTSWLRSEFKQEYKQGMGLHECMLDAFRAGLASRHQG